MTTPVRRLSAATESRVRDLAERRLTPEEVDAALSVPIGDEEREEGLSLVRWFRGRYKTPLERLAYVRRAYRRWAGSR